MSGVRSVLAAGILTFGALAAWGADATLAPIPKASTPRDSTPASPADHYVREALAAELDGDEARRDELLAQSLLADPNCRSARWQSGNVSVEGKWMTTDDAAAKFSADRNLTEYRRRRDRIFGAVVAERSAVPNGAGSSGENGNSVAGISSVEARRKPAQSPKETATIAELARWCRAKRLTDEERAHWTEVLQKNHSNREAQTRLGMRWYKGSLLTYSQIEAVKNQRVVEEKQLSQWKPAVLGWRKALNAGDASEKSQATADMRAVSDPAVIPALEWAEATDLAASSTHPEEATAFQREAVALLGRLPAQRAIYSLARHAVLAQSPELRIDAADELKKRPLHDFVPLLLAGLANPIRFDYGMWFDRANGVAEFDSVTSQKGQDGTTSVQYSNVASGLIPKTELGFECNTPVAFKTYPTVDPGILGSNWSQSGQRTAATVERQNAAYDLMNRRISSVLECVTGESSAPAGLADDPSQAIPDSAMAHSANSTADYWWNWWSDYNETNVSSKPDRVVQYTRLSDYSGPPVGVTGLPTGAMTLNPSTSGAHHSCFAAGTPVLTLTGPQAIEKLQIGDRVLAQDPDAGELAYKPVLATSKSPPSKLLRITTSRGAVRLTLGHPFWIVGKGWRMAKELHVGDRIHALHGIAVVMAIESQPMEPVYNLNVADFGTYFVSDGQLLVHDFTPRLPSRALLPGYVADGR
jgi:hypothetical protein